MNLHSSEGKMQEACHEYAEEWRHKCIDDDGKKHDSETHKRNPFDLYNTQYVTYLLVHTTQTQS